MDFSVLSKYDDFLASYFLDNLYLWFSTLRMNSDFMSVPFDKSETIGKIRELVDARTTPAEAIRQAVKTFLEFPQFKDYTNTLSKKQVEEFTQHAKKYLWMFMPNAGFEVCSTTRYTGGMEACVVATKSWKAGEQVTCCLGAIAALSEQDDAKLKSEGRDFSVMVSTRKKCACLFLGPARFMNHDCEANCKFILIGQNAITFKVEKDIAIGMEMTVYYADHYFGEDNKECRCASCERNQTGHYSVEAKTQPDDSEVDSATPSSEDNSSIRRSGRKRKEIYYKDFCVPDQLKKSRAFDTKLKKKATALIEITNKMDNAELLKDLCLSQETMHAHNKEMNLTKMEVEMTNIKETNWSFISTDVNSQPLKNSEDQYAIATNNQKSKDQGSLEAKMDVSDESVSTTNLPPQSHTLDHSPNYSLEIQSKKDSIILEDESGSMLYINDWIDALSDLSDDEKTSTSDYSCCNSGKALGLTSSEENPEQCVRCSRHYQIYGFEWPMRKMRRCYWKSKKTNHAQLSQENSNTLETPRKRARQRITSKPKPEIKEKHDTLSMQVNNELETSTIPSENKIPKAEAPPGDSGNVQFLMSVFPAFQDNSLPRDSPTINTNETVPGGSQQHVPDPGYDKPFLVTPSGPFYDSNSLIVAPNCECDQCNSIMSPPVSYLAPATQNTNSAFINQNYDPNINTSDSPRNNLYPYTEARYPLDNNTNVLTNAKHDQPTVIYFDTSSSSIPSVCSDNIPQDQRDAERLLAQSSNTTPTYRHPVPVPVPVFNAALMSVERRADRLIFSNGSCTVEVSVQQNPEQEAAGIISVIMCRETDGKRYNEEYEVSKHYFSALYHGGHCILTYLSIVKHMQWLSLNSTKPGITLFDTRRRYSLPELGSYRFKRDSMVYLP